VFNESTDIDIASSIGEASRVEAANECLLVMAEEELEVERQARHAVEGEREVLQRFGVASVVQSVKSEMKATERETLLLRDVNDALERETLLLRDVNQARVERQRAELKAKESELKALRSGNDALEIGERYTAVTGC